ncbi:MAG: hypothetical protein J2P52_01925 [Blastocatellia bacterium]|nr:hypothetical protein [Blastocatellia bacterium]
MADDNMNGIESFLLKALGVASVLAAIGGVYPMGMAIYRNHISLSDKQFLFGAFLLSFAFFLRQPAKILYRGDYDHDKQKWLWAFSWAALFWTVASGALAYYLGRLLYPLIRQ